MSLPLQTPKHRAVGCHGHCISHGPWEESQGSPRAPAGRSTQKAHSLKASPRVADAHEGESLSLENGGSHQDQHCSTAERATASTPTSNVRALGQVLSTQLLASRPGRQQVLAHVPGLLAHVGETQTELTALAWPSPAYDGPVQSGLASGKSCVLSLFGSLLFT